MITPLAHHREARGAALILALIFIAGIAILTMSTLSLSRNEVKVASLEADGSRIDIAITAGFEEAKNLLLNSVAGDQVEGSFKGDDYLVTAVREQGKETDESSRYTYIMRPEGDAYRAIPLFAGGMEESFAINDGSDPFLAPPMRPKVEWESGTQPEEIIELSSLTDLRSDGSTVKEYSRPKTIWKNVQPNLDPGATREDRYTYWIEDLQGYPDISMVGNPGLESGNAETSVNARRAAMRWGGYSPGDSRTVEGAYPLDENQCLAPADYQLAFPDALALRNPETNKTTYQRLSGQVAPGLSPREVHYFPWRSGTADGELFTHPYSRVANLRANGEGLVSAGSIASLTSFEQDVSRQRTFPLNVEQRFNLGLHGYREIPLVPPGFGYPPASVGQPRRNLNKWLRQVELDGSPATREAVLNEIVQYLKEMLPLFEKRKGAFPEDYLKTLAATMVDYADTDSMSTVKNPVFSMPYQVDNDKNCFRGMDNFPIGNEFFIKITYDGPREAGGDKKHLDFRYTPYVELWNPTNREVQVSGLKLAVRFLDRYGVKVKALGDDNAKWFELTNASGNSVAMVTPGFALRANEYRVVKFGDVKASALWEPPANPDIIPQPIVDKLVPKEKTMAEVHYELFWNGQVIDRSGRLGFNPANGKEDKTPSAHGIMIAPEPPTNSKGTGDLNADAGATSGDSTVGGQFLTGRFFIRGGAAAMANEFGSNSQGTGYGDLRMAYYLRSQNKPLSYTRDSTPGGRNVNRSNVTSGSKPIPYYYAARSWAWADGGFDQQIPAYNLRPSLSKPPIEPDEFHAPDEVQTPPWSDKMAAMAPWRISNQGRYYSVSELGNIYDPVMWRPNFGPPPPSSKGITNQNLLAKDFATMEKMVLSIGRAAFEDRKKAAQQFGGGNSLRIGRLEHAKFDEPGMRAAQLLDIFQCGNPGTNCVFLKGTPPEMEVDDSVSAYEQFRSSVHALPPSAPDAAKAKERPYRDLYPEDLHASGLMRWVHGQININSAPSLYEMEAFLRGSFASANIKWDNASGKAAENPTGFAACETGAEIFENALNTEADPQKKDVKGRPRKTVSEVAHKLMLSRPFRSPAHLAAVVAQAIGPSDRETTLLGAGQSPKGATPKGSALPNWCNDAQTEETFARLLNATTLSSRHFRVYVKAESIARRPAALGNLIEDRKDVVATALRVYDVFLNPVRNANGKIITTQCNVFSSQSF